MGAVWRKTIPAMATTIVGFAVVRIPIHNLRRHLISQHQDDRRSAHSNADGRRTRSRRLDPQPNPHGHTDVRTSNQRTPAEHLPLRPRRTVWTLQTIEAAISLVLTAALIAICLAVVVRSRPH